MISSLTESPPSLVARSVPTVADVCSPNGDVVLVEVVDRLTSASTTAAGTAITSIAFEMFRKLRVQILNVASIRSPTPSGLSMGGGACHMALPVAAAGVAPRPVGWPATAHHGPPLVGRC